MGEQRGSDDSGDMFPLENINPHVACRLSSIKREPHHTRSEAKSDTYMSTCV